MGSKPLSKADAYNRAAAKCSLGEQCSSDIYNKCVSWGLSEKESREVVDMLIDERFIDDHRFAGAFTRDKIRYQGWGKIKIAYYLRIKGIDSHTIRDAANSISDEEYFDALKKIIQSKLKSIPASKSPLQIRSALARYASSRGFESGLIFMAIDEVLTPCDTECDEYLD
ncbi:MAG: RecX family transcriptional regulator [Muribaculaceae bacterium]|nr:RecX family transcriptional regulator [Muribaculaceae bacterium]